MLRFKKICYILLRGLFWFLARKMRNRTVCLFGNELQWWFHYKLTPDSFFAVCLISNLSNLSLTTVDFLSYWRCKHLAGIIPSLLNNYFQAVFLSWKVCCVDFAKSFSCVDFYWDLLKEICKNVLSLFENELQ